MAAPRRADGVDQARGPRRGGSGEEAVAPAGDPLERGGLEATEQDLGAAAPGRGGANGTDVIVVGLTGPQAAHERHLLVQAPTASLDVGAGGQVVVEPAADAEAEHQAPVAEPVQGRRLLGEQGRLAQGRQQHLGLQPNAGSGARDDGERHQGLGVVVDEPVEQPEGAEGTCVAAPRPVEQRRRVGDGQAKADVHAIPQKEGTGKDRAAPPSPRSLYGDEGRAPVLRLTSREPYVRVTPP